MVNGRKRRHAFPPGDFSRACLCCYLLQNVRHRYLSMNWAFNNFQVGPRVMKDLLMHYTGRRHISYVFNEGFSVFFDWLARYFPGGLD